MIVNASAEF